LKKGVEKSAARTALHQRSSIDRASLLRHLAICVAAVAAYAMRREWLIDTGVLLILGFAGITNVATVRLSDTPRWTGLARAISPVLGVGSWAALVFVSGGTRSPFLPGFWLEIIFSALIFSPRGTAFVTAAACAALWAIQAWIGFANACGLLCLQTGFLSAIGTVTFVASRRWRQEHQSLRGETRDLKRRLQGLEEERESSRTLEVLGERTARLAHGLKGTVHSLRGFAQLIEMPVTNGHTRQQAIDGLRHSIDRLEDSVRGALHPSRASSEAQGSTTAPELLGLLDEVAAQMARFDVGVRWVKPSSERLPSVALPTALLREVLLILAENAAEASGASGEIVLRADVEAGGLRLMVQDDGPGFDPKVREILFKPGVTTKPAGSGFGLFLARRLIESRGGQLIVGQGSQGGALVSVRLPVVENQS